MFFRIEKAVEQITNQNNPRIQRLSLFSNHCLLQFRKNSLWRKQERIQKLQLLTIFLQNISGKVKQFPDQLFVNGEGLKLLWVFFSCGLFGTGGFVSGFEVFLRNLMLISNPLAMLLVKEHIPILTVVQHHNQ